MQLTTSLRWALYYRGLALVSFLVGAAVAGAGVWIGLYDVLVAVLDLASGSGTASDALASSRPLAGGALVVLGFAIWQLGKTAAFYKTLTQATESEMADRFDTQTLKSELLAALDDQLSELHADVETTRRQVGRLSREEHAAEFDVEGDAADSVASGDERGATSSGGERSAASESGRREAASSDAGENETASGGRQSESASQQSESASQRSESASQQSESASQPTESASRQSDSSNR